MAWSSWNYFAFSINETIALEIGDALISTGLAKLGYQHVNIDAGSFTGERDPETGKIVPNMQKYPHGMRWLSDQLHAKGLKFGVYTDISLHTCGGSGSMGHYTIDADTYAHDWQIDYLKVDFCGSTAGPTNLSNGRVSYQQQPQYDAWMALGRALNATGRPIYYSICPHRPIGAADGLPQEWVGDVAYAPPPEWTAAERHALANSILVEYTNTFDSWYSPVGARRPDMHGGVITDIDSMLQLTNLSFSGPGSWNDADMLQLCTYGKGGTPHSAGGMTLAEYRAHYSVWAVLASPLIISADLRTIQQEHPDCLELMLNPEIVAVNQDPAGLPARLISQQTNGSTINQRLRVSACSDAAPKWRMEDDGSIRVGPPAASHPTGCDTGEPSGCGVCLDAFNCGTTRGTVVDAWTCHPANKLTCGYTNQQWFFGPKGDTLLNNNSKTCLTKQNDSGVVLSPCAGSIDDAQLFTFNHDTGAIEVGGAGSGQCLLAQEVVSSADVIAQVFARPLAGNSLAVVLLNRDEAATHLTVSWADLGLPTNAKMAVRDVVNQRDLPSASGSWGGLVAKHDVAFIRLTPASD
jgi:alpha-galactosidase